MDTARLGRQLGTFTIDWIYFACLFLMIGFLGWLAIHDRLRDEFVWTYILCVTAAYYLVMLTLRQLRPRIHLYEEGVFVIDGGKKALFSWDELTHFEGQRRTTYINGIPAWRTGANQFFAGDIPAFRIGAMTNWADALADYCLSRMAERQIAPLEAIVRKGERLHLNLIDITTEGIGSPKDFFQWAQIKDIRLENNLFEGGTIVKAKIDGKFLYETLGVLGGIQGYAFLGLVDALTGSKYLPAMQAIVANPYKRLTQNKFLLAIMIIALLFAATLIISAVVRAA
jgi:hypothetical protein